MAKLPTDVSGEGDGLHTDLWCSTTGPYLSHRGEVDINEKVASTTNRTQTTFTIADGANGIVQSAQTYGVSGGVSLDEAFHRYAGYWRTGTGTYGTWQIYVDGSALGSPIAINDSQWSNGAYCFAGWMQQSNITFPGSGPGIDSSTSKNNPLYVQYFRTWRAR
jgi:hypothetical protein